MVRIYFYPNIDPRISPSPSPYMPCFKRVLKKKYSIVNQKHLKNGVLDMFKFFFKADLFLYSFIEDLILYRFGKFQVIFFVFFFLGIKTFRKKTVWIMHNKYSHDKKRNLWTTFMYSLMIKYSDLIITHSQAGVEFIEEKFPKSASKTKYLVHPVLQSFPKSEKREKKYDFFIWGTVYPYKGHLEFLEFLRDNELIDKYKVLIVGRCPWESYKEQLTTFVSDNIILDDNFYEIEEIAEMAMQSRFILFTHRPTSVLSSGALMDSIRMRTPIIGPNHGAFKDLSDYSFIQTYRDFDEILTFYEKSLDAHVSYEEELIDFYHSFSWDAFGEKFSNEVDRVIQKPHAQKLEEEIFSSSK